MTLDRPVKVVLADDHELVRRGFAALLAPEVDLDVVCEASTGCEAVDAAYTWTPDVVLMDIRMPELDGIEATRDSLDAARAEYETRVPPLIVRFDGLMQCDFAELDPVRAELESQRADIVRLAEEANPTPDDEVTEAGAVCGGYVQGGEP